MRIKYYNKTSGVEHQKNSNWCVGHAIASLCEAHFAKVYGEVVPLSNAWVMMLGKKADGRPDATGTKEDVALDQICKFGICPEDAYPTWEDPDVNDNVFLPDTKAHYEFAARFKPNRKRKLESSASILQAIENNGGVVFKLKLYKEHLYPDCGFVLQPAKGSQPMGLHEIVCVGYDLTLERVMNGRIEKGFFICQETYGETRGHRGHLYIPIRYWDEKVTGLYSADTYFQNAYTIESDNMPFKSFHDSNDVIIPQDKIILKLNDSTAYINDVAVTMPQPAREYDGRTFLPLRFVGEALNCNIDYSATDKRIKIYSQKRSLLAYVYAARDVAEVSKLGVSTQYQMLALPKVVNGTTLVPIRDICNILDVKIDFDNLTKKITILSIKY